MADEETCPEVSNVAFNESVTSTTANARPRRALVCAGPSVAQMLERQLASAGYVAVVASSDDAVRIVEQFAPSVVLIALHNGMDGARVALARRLRAEASTYALPIVFLYHKDERTQRSTALNIGVDDYFPLATPTGELCARLDALFWRAEAGRRAAPVVAEQRTEIDNFLVLLDTVRADLHGGRGVGVSGGGTLALVEAVTDNANAVVGAEHERLLAEAHGFLKLNLRRADAVAFYGPTMLLVYLPRVGARVAYDALARLHEEFIRKRPTSDLAIGLASFPADGADVETLIEKAEAAIAAARAAGASGRVITSESSGSESSNVSPPSEKTEPRVETENQDSTKAAQQQKLPTPTEDAGGSKHQTATATEFATPDARPLPDARPYVSAPHVVRESRTADALSTATLSAPVGNAAEAVARELERRARGEVMPRRLLLTVSDPARMAQLNLLIRSAGYDVRAAFDGEQALNLLRIERPDLLVLDYELQGMNGVEALRRLRKQSGGRLALPVVLLLDARQPESARREALDAGARAVVKLPYDPSELLETVRRAGSVE